MVQLPAHYSLAIAVIRRDFIFWTSFIAIVSAVSYFSFWMSQRRRRIWRQFAADHGLTFQSGEQPKVTGTVNGRPFSLGLVKQSSDRGMFGIQLVEMRLGIKTGSELDFTVKNEGIYTTALREASGDTEVVHVEQGEFDKRTTVKSAAPNLVAAFLTPIRRAAILSFIEQYPTCDVQVTNSDIIVGNRSTPKSATALTAQLHHMQLAAADLEA